MKVSALLAPALLAALIGGATTPGVKPERRPLATNSLEVTVEAALHRGDFLTALRTTETAHRRAARDRRWEPLIEVGDAYCRIASRAGAPDAASERARDAYQAALQSARRAQALDGVLRAAEGFAQLGDVDDVELSFRVGRDLAGSDAEAVDEVKAAAGRLGDLLGSRHAAKLGEE